MFAGDTKIMPSQSSRKTLLMTSILGASLFLAGCSINAEQFTETENVARVRDDLVRMFADQEPISAPITLTDAIARSLKYNLDHRLKVMEQAVAAREFDVAEFALLPNLVADAGYTTRSSYDASVSKNTTTGTTGIEPSTSDDKSTGTAELGLSWNILDFGIGYIRSKQQEDYGHIVEERRRQVVHNIAQDVRSAYWRAVAAERTLQRLNPLLVKVRQAFNDAQQLEKERVGSRVDALTYQRSLLEALRQLEEIKMQMEQARTELSVLMNLQPGSNFTLAAAQAPTPSEPLKMAVPVQQLELAALYNRSELRSESYQLRINANEGRVALLQMLPSLSMDTGYNYSSNSFLASQAWASGGAQVSWNLMKIFSGPANIDLADAKVDLSKIRRLALSMAVISQTNVAKIAFESSVYNFTLSQQMADIEGKIQQQRRAELNAYQGGSMEAIRAEMGALLANLRRDMAYADMQSSYGRMFATVGAEPLPNSIGSYDVGTISQAISQRFSEWQNGMLLPSGVMEELLAPVTPAQKAAAEQDAGDLGHAPAAAFNAGPDTVSLTIPANKQP
jgi:outer membrane protein TolC